MGTSQGTGGRSSAATVNANPSDVLKGFVDSDEGFEVATRGRTAKPIEGLTAGLAAQIRTDSGVFWYNGPKTGDLRFKSQVTKWVASFGLKDGQMTVTYSAPKDLGNKNIARGVKVRIADDAIRAQVAEKLAARQA